MTRDLPPLDFVLTPPERVQAAVIALHLERLRRERNARDQASQKRNQGQA